jgi:hypothetical protein
VRRVGLEGQIAELVDDQQLGLGIEGQALLEPAVCVGLASAAISAVAAAKRTE